VFGSSTNGLQPDAGIASRRLPFCAAPPGKIAKSNRVVAASWRAQHYDIDALESSRMSSIGVAVSEPHDGSRHTRRLEFVDTGYVRSCGGKPLVVWLSVRDIDAVRDPGNLPANNLAVTHQFDLRRIAFMDQGELRFLRATVV
jgi:hypothetical protein